MSLLASFVEQREFSSYEDFRDHLRIRVPARFNFAYDVVDVYAQTEPERLALVWCNDNQEERFFNFADMKNWSHKAACFFQARGIRKGDRVLLIMKGRYEFWFCLLGLHRLGAIAVPATHLVTENDLVYRIEHAGIRMIVSVDEGGLPDAVEGACLKTGGQVREKALLGPPRAGWLDFQAELEKAPTHFTRPTGPGQETNDDISLLYFSSGTTGFPKMVPHSFVYPLGHILTAGFWQNVQEGGLHYTVADTGWAKCVWGKIYGQWICGSAVFAYDYDRFNAHNMLEKVVQYKVTTFCAPPTVYRFLIKEDLSHYDFSALKYCVVAGEPLNPEVYERFLQATGRRLMEGFGQTESVVSIATFPWMDPKPGSMGRPAAGYPIELMNHAGEACDTGEEGEIVINTKGGVPLGMFPGYYRDEAQTRKAWHDGYYHTGDMAWMDEDGYFWFVGRADDLIKSSGYKIGPFEVESALMKHPAVLECAVTGVPDPDRGQVVKATIVLARGHTPSDALAHELQAHVRQVTAPYKYPRQIEFVEQLPKTISGKIRRVEIRARDEENSAN